MDKLESVRPDATRLGSKPFVYDAEHERKRKEQLKRLYDRTPEQAREMIILFERISPTQSNARWRKRRP